MSDSGLRVVLAAATTRSRISVDLPTVRAGQPRAYCSHDAGASGQNEAPPKPAKLRWWSKRTARHTGNAVGQRVSGSKQNVIRA